MFFRLPKEVGGVLRMPHFSPEMVWHTLSFSTYVHTDIYIHTCMHSTRPWGDHYKRFFLAEIFLGVWGGHPYDGQFEVIWQLGATLMYSPSSIIVHEK